VRSKYDLADCRAFSWLTVWLADGLVVVVGRAVDVELLASTVVSVGVG
jgi:hypothetical protein